MLKPRVAAGPSWPASFTQSGFWEMAKMLPAEPLRNISGTWRIDGALDEQVLRRTLLEIHRRHDLLRASFSETRDAVIANVQEVGDVDFEVVDLGDQPEHSREAEALERCAALKSRAFDVTKGPLSLMRLYRLGNGRSVLFMLVDHIVFDGWSYGVLMDEINAIYPALRDGKPSPLPELPIQFQDFAAWERDQLRGQRLEELMGYWQARLADNRPAIPIPTDFPRPRDYRHQQLRFEICDADSAALRAFARRQRATLFMALMAAYNVWLWRLSGLDDLSVVLPVANRAHQEMRTLIGPALNLIVLRTRLQPGWSFAELLESIRRECLSAYAHQEMPFEVLLQRLGQNASYRAMLAMENYPLAPLRLPEARVELLDGDAGAAFYDFTMVFFDTQPRLGAYLAYNGALFRSDSIERHVAEFRRLLRELVARPDVALGAGLDVALEAQLEARG